MNRKSIYSCLIIGYGNTLRGDDGVGCYLADRMAEQSWSGLRSQSVHQLTPELVVEMAEVQQVIFIDAYPSDIPQIRVEKLSSKSYRQGLDHTGNPQYLLALTEQLYGKQPDAWWVLIPGKNFELSETLSSLTQSCLSRAILIIQQLVLKNDPSIEIADLDL